MAVTFFPKSYCLSMSEQLSNLLEASTDTKLAGISGGLNVRAQRQLRIDAELREHDDRLKKLEAQVSRTT